MSDPVSIWCRDGFVDDAWREVADDESLPEDGKVLVSAARWREMREGNLPNDRRIGVSLAADDRVEDLSPDLDLFDLIALDFPSFTDGRSYSAARLLRERYGYAGDLRARGDVLLDQIPFMLRCGFSSFAISHGPTRRALAEGHLPEVPIYLQPVGGQGETPLGNRPWMRTRA
ncbi:DUF934 domain-containing protein [Microbaculum marinum]|uniref:DUF934 domain-containing protein n=1 Tax=Microbaculum marinum TaxID=1764581 RepID=A0AAW9RR61_9HYPH